VDPETGRLLGTDENARYPLALLVSRRFDLDISADKHAPDALRPRYGALDGLPLDQWPEGAVKYPLRDAHATRVSPWTSTCPKSAPRPASPTAAICTPRGPGPCRPRAPFRLRVATAHPCRTRRAAALPSRAGVEDQPRALPVRRHLPRQRHQGFKAPRPTRHRCLQRRAPDTAPSERFPDGQVETDRDTLLGSGDGLLEDLGKSGRVDEYKSTYLDVVEASTALPVNPRFNVLVCRFSKKPGGTPRITSPCVFPENFSSVGGRRARREGTSLRKSEPGGHARALRREPLAENALI